MKQLMAPIIILFILCSCSTQERSSEYVEFPDEQIAGLIRWNLKIEDDDPIPVKKLKELTELELGFTDPKKYDLTGIEYATGLEKLTISHAHNISDIKPLEKLNALKSLTINRSSISDISPLSKLTQLRELSLYEGFVRDISPLKNLTQLNRLVLVANPISDFSPLTSLSELNDLSIYRTELSDLKPLANLEKLTQLRLSYNKISDISPLEELTQLTTLSLDNNRISNIAPLNKLTNLTRLYIYDNPLSDISALANLQKLESLEFHEHIPDISPLSALTKLKSLSFSVPPPEIDSLATMTSLTSLEFYDSTISDISPLTGLTELRELKLYRNKIEDITPLSGMTKLEKLELYKNNITDISPLAGMIELTELRLDGNRIVDISPLANLTKLNVLGLERNQVRDVKPIENLQHLTILYLKHNPVEDTSPIQKLFANTENLNNPETLYPKHRPSPHPRVFHQHETRSELPEGAIARLGKGGINVIKFSPDGKFLAVGSDVGIYLYSVETGDEVALPNKTIGQVNAIAFSSDSNILAIGGYLRPTIQLWNLKTRTELPPFSIPVSHRINQDIPIQSAIALAFGVKDTILVCVSHFGEVTYWDMNTREKIVEHHTDADWDGNILALSTDGRIFARGSGVGLHHGGPKGQISLWNTSAGNRETKTGGHSPLSPWSKKRVGIRALAFSPDGKTFASGSEDMTVRIWNTKRGSKRATLKGHTGWVTAVSFSKDGNTIASGDTDGKVRVWNVQKKRELVVLEGHSNTVVALAFTPDGNTLASASADGAIHFWNPNSGERISTFTNGYTEWVRSMAFSSDSKTLSAAMFNNTVRKYDIKKGDIIDEFTQGIQKLTQEITLSPDGTHLASQPINGIISFNARHSWRTDESYQGHDRIEVWDLKNGKELPPLMHAYGKMAFSSNNEMLVSGFSYENEKMINHSGTRVYTGGGGDHIWFWDVQSDKNKFYITPEDYTSFYPIAFTPDGKKLVYSDRSNGTEIWDYNTREKVQTYEDRAYAFAISQDGNLMACIEFFDISLWDLNTAELIKKIDTHAIKGSYGYSLQGAKGKVLTFSPDGSILLVSSVSRIHSFCSDAIDLIDIETGNKLHALPGHTEPIETLVFSHDGKILASGSQDGTVLLWDWDKVVTDIMLENKWQQTRNGGKL
ncbi:hypothetical protein F4X73_11440 [Candidatus Poribacteria bacterium]|nr:hypothetical protein [Candidatus Poribacteria bacterium]